MCETESAFAKMHLHLRHLVEEMTSFYSLLILYHYFNQHGN